MAQRIGGGLIGQRIRLPLRDGARLEAGDHPQPSAQQAQDRIAQVPGDLKDLRRAVVPLGVMIGPRDGVAQRRQAGGQDGIVACRAGLAHRFRRQFKPLILRDDQRSGHREPGQDQRAQRPGLAGQRVPRLFEQTDLLAVEQLDLEPGGPAAEAKGGPGQQVRPSRPAASFGGPAEPSPAAVQVARCQPGRAPGRAPRPPARRHAPGRRPAGRPHAGTSARRPRRPGRPWPDHRPGGHTRWPARPQPGQPGPGGRRPRRRPRPGRGRPARPAAGQPGRASSWRTSSGMES